MFDSIQKLAIQQLRDLDSSIRLVLVHPGYSGQRVLLHHLLGERPSLYVCLTGLELTQAELDTQFEAVLRQQQGDTAPGGIRQIILDECDRAQSAALTAFMEGVLSRFADVRLVVLSRLTPQEVLENEKLRAAARFVPVSQSMLLPDYLQQEGDAVHLEVRALGGGRVLLNGRLISEWDGTLPRALFFYLVDRGMTTRSKIFETFWPNLPTREATNVFHVTKRKISEVLGTDLTVYWSGFYHLSPKINLIYDTALFSEMVQNSAVASNEEATRLLTDALLLYKGDYLTSLEMEWVQTRRQELHQTYGEVLIGLAKAMEREDKPRHALGLYLRAAVTNPQREDIARSIMQLYHKLGMHADALATYDRLEAELERSLSVSPLPAIQELAASIRTEMKGVPAQAR